MKPPYIKLESDKPILEVETASVYIYRREGDQYDRMEIYQKENGNSTWAYKFFVVKSENVLPNNSVKEDTGTKKED